MRFIYILLFAFAPMTFATETFTIWPQFELWDCNEAGCTIEPRAAKQVNITLEPQSNSSALVGFYEMSESRNGYYFQAVIHVEKYDFGYYLRAYLAQTPLGTDQRSFRRIGFIAFEESKKPELVIFEGEQVGNGPVKTLPGLKIGL